MQTQRGQEREQCDQSQKKANDRSLKYFHGEAAPEAVAEAGNAYAPASLVACGAGEQAIGMLSALNNLAAALLYTKVPAIIEKMGSRKKAIVLLSFVDALGWLPLITILLFLKPVNPLWLIPCWIVNLIPGMLYVPARSAWMADLVPGNTRGRYFGVRSAISGGAYIGTFYVMAYVLHMFEGPAIEGFIIVFALAFVASFLCFLIYTRIHSPPGAAEKATDFGFFDFLHETGKRNLGRFILYISLFQFAVYLSSPFIVTYMLKDLGFSYMYYAVIFGTEFLAKVVIVTFWGRYADKVGNLKVMRMVSLAIPFVPLLWLASHNLVYLVFVQLFSGACWAGFDLCSMNFIYEAAPAGKRLKYIAYHRALSTFFMALGALAGASLLGFVRPVFGYPILSLFVLSGVLRFVVTIVMFPRLKEVRGTMRNYLETPLAAAASLTWMHRPGLWHRTKEWARYRRPAAEAIPVPVLSGPASTGRGLLHRRSEFDRSGRARVAEAVPIRGQERPTNLGRGLFFRRNDWSLFGRRPVAEPVPVLGKNEGTTDGRGLFHRPQTWDRYRKPGADEAAAGNSRSERVGANWGLFYRPGEWEMFGRPVARKPAHAVARL